MINICIVEDDEHVRKYLEALIHGAGKFNVAGTFGNGDDALEFLSVQLLPIDIVLTDIQMPGIDGIQLVGALKEKRPEILFMMLTVYEDVENIFRALKSGASGYILKHTTPVKLLDALEDLYNGGSPMSGPVARKIVTSFQTPEGRENLRDRLSLREKEVLDWLSKGYSYKEIANELFISIETVRTHIRNIYEKLHVRNRSEALKKSGYR